jgi:Ca2+-binding EF-hand superfamily protein
VTGATTRTTSTTTTEFVDLDVDHDGYLIVSEAAKNPDFSKVWVEYDKDGDKRITRVEYDAYRTIAMKQPVASTTTTTTTTRRQFVDFDTDADGFIVVNDLPRDEPFVQVWTTYDKDGDKRITRVEYDAYLAAAAAPASTATTTTTTTTTRREFVALDANADGYLVVSEIPKDNDFAKVYVEYDKDGDSRITRTEYDAWYTVEVDED